MTGGYLQIDSNLVLPPGSNASVNLIVDSSLYKENPEGYDLIISKGGIELTAGTEAGLFYGLQTINQLMTPQGLPYTTIKDTPRFPYRGLHLDVSRLFFSI